MPPPVGENADYIAQVNRGDKEWQMALTGVEYGPLNDVTARTTLGLLCTRSLVSVQSVFRLWVDGDGGDHQESVTLM